MKFVDDLINKTRKMNLDAEKSIFKWVIFNLKLQCLFREVELMKNLNDYKNCRYLTAEIGILSHLFASRSFKEFNVVSIDEFESCIKRKFAELSSNKT